MINSDKTSEDIPKDIVEILQKSETILEITLNFKKRG
jgi:hypothetical protein